MRELREWLILIRTPGLGINRLHSLLAEFGTPAQLVGAPPGKLKQRGISGAALAHLASPDEALIERDARWLEQPDHALIVCDDPDYPPQLKEIAGAPPALFVIGNPAVLWLPQLAVVGSRQPTQGGLLNARAFTEALAREGLIITSGLALGIDGAAHSAALEAGSPTVAVAATGLDRVYPARHRELAQRIADSGALVSEFPPGTPPKRYHFPRRNRIISGLSLGVLVVEAGINSGSLITARMASEQGRDVFAIPGSIHNPLSRGCHRLIKQGAKLVEGTADLIDEIAGRARAFAREQQVDLQRPAPDVEAPIEARNRHPNLRLDDEYQRLLQAVGYDPVTVDGLVEATGLTPEAVSSMLLILELSGLVETGPGGSYSRTGEESR